MTTQQKPPHDETATERYGQVVDALWEFLYQHNARPHNCRSRGFGPGAVETSANLEVVGNAADDIMEIFGYDRAKIPMEE